MRLTLALERRAMERTPTPSSTLAEIDWDTGRLVYPQRPQAWQPQGLIPRASIRAARALIAATALTAIANG